MARKKPSLSQKIRKNLLGKISYYKKAGFDVDISVPAIPDKTASPQEKSKYTKTLKKLSKQVSDLFSLNKKRSKEDREKIISIREQKKADQFWSGNSKKHKKHRKRTTKKSATLPDIPEKFRKIYQPKLKDLGEEDIVPELRKDYQRADQVYEGIMDAVKDMPVQLQETLQGSIDRLIEEYGKDQLMIIFDKMPPDVIASFQLEIMYSSQDKGETHRAIRGFFDAVSRVAGEIPEIQSLKEAETAASESEQF